MNDLIPAEVLRFVDAYAQHVAVGAGAAGALVAIYTIRRFTKKHEHDDVAANLGVALMGVVTTEGMWDVVYNQLRVPAWLTVLMFAAFDVVIYSQGRQAIRKLKTNPKARVGTYLAIIWALSVAASLTVSTAGGNVTTQLFRFFSPMVAAALWTQKVLELRNGKAERQESNWIWTPTRILVEKGWMKPGAADDLSEVFRKRRIAALVDAGLELRAQQEAAKGRPTEQAKSSRWRKQEDPLVAAQRKVQRLTKAASREDVAAAREQLLLTLNVERELFRADDELDERGRQALDDVRLIMRQATTKLRAEHAQAFGSAQRGGPDSAQVWSNGLVRMPAQLAAQIRPNDRPNPVAQVRPSLGAAERPNARPNSDAAAQPVTRVSVPAERAATTRATTVRVDRAKPVSPAGGGEIPPRIRDMVRDLKRTYRGDIPSRTEVMKRLGWTSKGDASTAIKLVRDERAAKTTKES
ncbi:hypothetical protein [Micromonospora sp. NPDC023814]|uniref:hypothetical protein n=1 Tax=Micromonospora sp. NPDC023814 TaxID=3154596 RepID=UPI0034058FCF